MHIRKTLLAAAAAAALLIAAPAANAFVGGWYYDNNAGGLEVLHLGDSSDDTYLVLRGTDRYCSRPGVSYATVRNLLNSVGGPVNWWIDNECDDGYLRICVSDSQGWDACSTYANGGWRDS